MTKDILTNIVSIISLVDNPKTSVSLTANGNTLSLNISEDLENDTQELSRDLQCYLLKSLEEGHIQSYEYKAMGSNQLLTVKY